MGGIQKGQNLDYVILESSPITNQTNLLELHTPKKLHKSGTLFTQCTVYLFFIAENRYRLSTQRFANATYFPVFTEMKIPTWVIDLMRKYVRGFAQKSTVMSSLLFHTLVSLMLRNCFKGGRRCQLEESGHSLFLRAAGTWGASRGASAPQSFIK